MRNLPPNPGSEVQAGLAFRCQETTEALLEEIARQALEQSGCENLAVAGGVFLNILTNTRLARLSGVSSYHVPSAPHDAGIAVGCAFFGSRMLGVASQPVTADRLGRRYNAAECRAAVDKAAFFVEATLNRP